MAANNVALSTGRGRVVRRGLASDQAGLIVAIVALCLVYSLKTPYFLDSTNFSNIGVAISYGGIMAAGFALVMICGGLDLSISGVAALSGQALAFGLTHDWSTAGAVTFALADRRRLRRAERGADGRDRDQRDRRHDRHPVPVPRPRVRLGRRRRRLDRDRERLGQQPREREMVGHPGADLPDAWRLPRRRRHVPVHALRLEHRGGGRQPGRGAAGRDPASASRSAVHTSSARSRPRSPASCSSGSTAARCRAPRWGSS